MATPSEILKATSTRLDPRECEAYKVGSCQETGGACNPTIDFTGDGPVCATPLRKSLEIKKSPEGLKLI